jgi:hypothetical protein
VAENSLRKTFQRINVCAKVWLLTRLFCGLSFWDYSSLKRGWLDFKLNIHKVGLLGSAAHWTVWHLRSRR